MTLDNTNSSKENNSLLYIWLLTDKPASAKIGMLVGGSDDSYWLKSPELSSPKNRFICINKEQNIYLCILNTGGIHLQRAISIEIFAFSTWKLLGKKKIKYRLCGENKSYPFMNADKKTWIIRKRKRAFILAYSDNNLSEFINNNIVYDSDLASTCFSHILKEVKAGNLAPNSAIANIYELFRFWKQQQLQKSQINKCSLYFQTIIDSGLGSIDSIHGWNEMTQVFVCLISRWLIKEPTISSSKDSNSYKTVLIQYFEDLTNGVNKDSNVLGDIKNIFRQIRNIIGDYLPEIQSKLVKFIKADIKASLEYGYRYHVLLIWYNLLCCVTPDASNGALFISDSLGHCSVDNISNFFEITILDMSLMKLKYERPIPLEFHFLNNLEKCSLDNKIQFLFKLFDSLPDMNHFCEVLFL